MNYKCEKCGHIFEDGEWREDVFYVGECFGQKVYDKTLSCSMCGGSFEEVKECSICGKLSLESELISNVCENCLDECRNDFQKCYKVSLNDSDAEIKINSLLASLFTQSEIEAILIDFINHKEPHISCNAFINQDINWFATMLNKERKNIK